MDRMVVEGDTEALISEITELSLDFGFVTPYTSLFVEVPVIDKISEATTEPGTLEEPGSMATATTAYTPSPTQTPAYDGVDATVEATEAPMEAATEAATVEATEEPTDVPGFGVLFAFIGLAAVAYLVRR